MVWAEGKHHASIQLRHSNQEPIPIMSSRPCKRIEGKRFKLLNISLIMSNWPRSKRQATLTSHSPSSRLLEWLLPGKPLAEVHSEWKLGHSWLSSTRDSVWHEALLSLNVAGCPMELWGGGLSFSTLQQQGAQPSASRAARGRPPNSPRPQKPGPRIVEGDSFRTTFGLGHPCRPGHCASKALVIRAD